MKRWSDDLIIYRIFCNTLFLPQQIYFVIWVKLQDLFHHPSQNMTKVFPTSKHTFTNDHL